MFGKIINKIFEAVSWACCIMLCLQVILVTITVFCRYLFKVVPIWGESVTLFCLVWTSMIGAALPIRTDSHIRITVIDKLLGQKLLKASNMFVDLGCIIYAVIICYGGIAMAGQVANVVMNGMRISKAYLFASVPVAMILIILAFVEKYYLRIKEAKSRKEAD